MTTRNQMYQLAAFDRPKLDKPFPVEWRGEYWDCVTNGHALLMINDGSYWPKPEDTVDVSKHLLTLYENIDEWRGERSVDTGNLLEWAFGEPEPCQSCMGAGYVEDETEGGWNCGCPDGMSADSFATVAGDVFFNRRLLYRFLRVAMLYTPDESVTIKWQSPIDSMWLVGSSFIIALMPMRDPGKEPAALEELWT